MTVWAKEGPGGGRFSEPRGPVSPPWVPSKCLRSPMGGLVVVLAEKVPKIPDNRRKSRAADGQCQRLGEGGAHCQHRVEHALAVVTASPAHIQKSKQPRKRPIGEIE